MNLNGQTDKRRVYVTEEMLQKFFNIFKGAVSEFASDKGLPYLLVYNLAHGRIKSVSAKDYKKIFGEEPPYQETQRVDGKYFRGMVRLWLFLNGDTTQKDIYRELYQGKKHSKIDDRIFTGRTKTVNIRLEQTLEQKFLDQGLARPEIEKWIEELYQNDDEKRVPYQKAKPVVDYLKEVLNISPKRILNQSPSRYESGQLRTVSMKKHKYILNLRKKAEKALRSASKFEIENLREQICGKREGMTLFSEIEDQLEFLWKYRGNNSRKYLGRSITNYKKSKLLRIAPWRAQKIRNDCDELIREKPEIQLLSLPKFHMRLRMSEFVSVLKSLLIMRMIEDESRTYERLILAPSCGDMEVYRKRKHISMDDTASALGMHKKAFDMMVATHSDIFRRVARYDGRWHLPMLYVKELKEKQGFSIVKEKYELLAKGDKYSLRSGGGEAQRAHSSDTQSSRTMMAKNYQDVQGPAYYLMNCEPALAKGNSTNLQTIVLTL
jgi:hypothetical protein